MRAATSIRIPVAIAGPGGPYRREPDGAWHWPGRAGAYHSHPHSPPIPSETDRLEAYYDEFIWMIVSLSVPEPAAVSAYRLSDGRFVPVAIEVVL